MERIKTGTKDKISPVQAPNYRTNLLLFQDKSPNLIYFYELIFLTNNLAFIPYESFATNYSYLIGDLWQKDLILWPSQRRNRDPQEKCYTEYDHSKNGCQISQQV